MALQEFRERMARIHTNARAKLDEITDTTPEDRAAEISAEFDAMMRDYDKLEAQAERERKLDGIRAKLDVDPRRPGFTGSVDGADKGEVPSYRDAFREYLAAGGQLSDMPTEARAVLKAGYQEVRAQTAGTTTAGGFTVPTELQNMLVKTMAAWGPMYDGNVVSEMVTSGGNALTIPTVNDTARALTTTAEGVTYTDDGSADATFGQKQLDAYTYNTKWLRVSLELAQDSIFNMEAILADLLGEGLGRGTNTQLTTGTGSSAPNGIVTASTLGKTAASATAVTFDEIMDFMHSVDPAYRDNPKARFMLHDSILLTIRKLKDGQSNYLWQEGNVRDGAPATILGKPYSINQAMDSAMTTAKKIMLFGDFSKYYVRKVGAPVIGAIQDKDFFPGFGIAGYVRFDGELVDTAAVKRLVLA
jgi:HK97 family phage major capsid protein